MAVPHSSDVQRVVDFCKAKSRTEKWRTTVGTNEFYTGRMKELVKTGNVTHLLDFIANVPINATDRRFLTNMHMAAAFGEPEIVRTLIELGAKPCEVDLLKYYPFHYVGIGRVAPSKVVELVQLLIEWDPQAFNYIIETPARYKLLLNEALLSENYVFYEYMVDGLRIMHLNPLSYMREPHSLKEEDVSIHLEFSRKDRYTADGEVPSLLRMCMSIIKMRSLASPFYRNRIKQKMPSEIVQLFVDCLPADPYAYRLLEFFKTIPGVHIDARQYYWSIYERELDYKVLMSKQISFARFSQILSVYDNPAKFDHPPHDIYDDPKEVKRFFENGRPYYGRSVVPFKTFQAEFAKFTNNFFDGYDWKNTAVIGSTVLACLRGGSVSGLFKNSDIDICFYGLTSDEFIAKAFNFISYVKAKFPPVVVLDTHECITLCLNYPFRRVQLMKGLWSSIENIIMHVDIDCTGFAYDGAKVWATPRAILAVNRRWSVPTNIHNQVRGEFTYEERLVKYAHRGFTIADFNFPKKVPWSKDAIVNRFSGSRRIFAYHQDYSQKIHGAPLVLLAEVLEKRKLLNYNMWERSQHHKELPPVSKAWPPKRILADILKGKRVYYSYGKKSISYESQFCPVSDNNLAANKQEYLTPIKNPEEGMLLRLWTGSRRDIYGTESEQIIPMVGYHMNWIARPKRYDWDNGDYCEYEDWKANLSWAVDPDFDFQQELSQFGCL